MINKDIYKTLIKLFSGFLKDPILQEWIFKPINTIIDEFKFKKNNNESIYLESVLLQ